MFERRGYREDDPQAVAAMRSRLIRHAGERCRPWHLTTYPADDAVGHNALRTVSGWLDGHPPGGLYIYGTVGSAKTGLAYCVARLCISDMYWVEWANTRHLLAELKHLYGEPGLDAYFRVDGLSCASVTVLDDLGSERSTEWSRDVFAQIIEHRSANALPTIVTTNYAPSQLAYRLAGRDDPVVGQRLVSRLLQDAAVIHLDRGDLRVSESRASS